jgi:class 3 adenylate cyclase/tetratricopeptide (TPR) repeat protein
VTAVPDDDHAVEALTIMITDVEGSAALRRARGDRTADEALRVHEAIVRQQVREYGGQERKFLGNGFLLSFASPVAAVRCAVGIEATLAEHNDDDPERALRVRIGIHTGEVSERRGELYGQAVHAAARIAAEAAGGRILVSDDVRRHAGADLGWELVDSGLYWLKGFAQRWRLYEVSWRPPEPPAPAPTPTVALTRFVGRDAERDTLRGAVGETLAGRGRCTLIGGEAGIGKSRLAAEIGAEAEARGFRVLTGHCVEMSGAPPYLPYVEMIEQAIGSPRRPLALRDALGDVAPEIARIAPVLRRVFPDIAPPVELPPEVAQRYLWNSFGEFLERGARETPLLLVIEDLHWADESTVLLTEYLAPLLLSMPVLMLGTYRDDEVGVSHPLSRVISQLERRRQLDRIHLAPLPPDGVREMVTALAGQPAPDELVRVIGEETEGNPFFVEELYLHLAEAGRLLDEQGSVRADLGAAQVPVPDSVRLVVGKRLENLSSPTRDTLVAAAVAGRFFAPHVVGEMTGLDGDALVDAFDEAERARIVEPVRGDGQLVFSHELIRQTLLSDVSALRRQRLHRRAADAIERLYANNVDAHAGDLAHHLSLAGGSADVPRLVRFLTIAGDRATEAAAWADAVDRYEHALALLDEGERETRAELLERLGGAQRSLGRWPDALRTMDQALTTFEALGRKDAIGRLSWSTVYQLTWSARLVEAAQVAQRALAALGDFASADRARLLGALGFALSIGGDHDRAAQLFEQARALAEQVRDERALADVLHVETIHHFAYTNLREGVRTGLRAAAVFERQRALWDLCSVQAFVIFEDGLVGGREQWRRLGATAMDVAERLGHVGAIFVLLTEQARQALARADLASLATLGRRMLEVGQSAGLPWIYIAHLMIGMAEHLRGDSERAEAEFRRAVGVEPPGAFAGRSAGVLAWQLAQSGRADEVMALYRAAQPTLPALDRVSPAGRWTGMLGLVEAMYTCGFRQEAASLSPLVERLLEIEPDWVMFDGHLVHTRAALAAAAAGRDGDADRHFTAARRQAERLGLRLEAVDLRRLRARVLLDRDGPGDRAEAAQLLAEALPRYREYGMPGYAGETERMLDAARR